MFDQLQDKFQDIFKNLRGLKTISEENIESAIREVKRALIDADVSLKAIKTFTNKVREKAIGQEVIKGVMPHQQFIKIISDELTELLGHEQKELNLTDAPSTILMLGLQGAGKTTTCAKLANFLKKKGKNPLLVPLDLKRPAAVEQLNILGAQIGVSVFQLPQVLCETHILSQNAVSYAKEHGHDVVILDSAGRLQIDTELMAELLLIDRIIQPQEKLLVIDSMIGQEAANIGAAFDTQIGVTGIVLTKLDGDARGGAALSIVEEIKKPIKLTGIGEKLDDLQEFYPDRIASRILGMGDVLTLVEKAQENIQEEEAQEIERKLLNDFNFETFLMAQNMTSKMGNFSGIFNMLGMSNMLGMLGINMDKATQEKMLSETEVKMKKFKAAIQSMTKKEKIKPDILNSSRKRRIAKGSGLKETDVDKMAKEFNQMRTLMNQFKPFMTMFKNKSGSMTKDTLKDLMHETNQPSLFGPKGQSGPKGNLLKGFKPKKK